MVAAFKGAAQKTPLKTVVEHLFKYCGIAAIYLKPVKGTEGFYNREGYKKT